MEGMEEGKKEIDEMGGKKKSEESLGMRGEGKKKGRVKGSKEGRERGRGRDGRMKGEREGRR